MTDQCQEIEALKRKIEDMDHRAFLIYDLGSKYISIFNTLKKFSRATLAADHIFGHVGRDFRPEYD